MKGLGRVVVGSAVGGLLGAASFFAVEAFADPGYLKQKWLDAGMEDIANPTATNGDRARTAADFFAQSLDESSQGRGCKDKVLMANSSIRTDAPRGVALSAYKHQFNAALKAC